MFPPLLINPLFYTCFYECTVFLCDPHVVFAYFSHVVFMHLPPLSFNPACWSPRPVDPYIAYPMNLFPPKPTLLYGHMIHVRYSLISKEGVLETLYRIEYYTRVTRVFTL